MSEKIWHFLPQTVPFCYLPMIRVFVGFCRYCAKLCENADNKKTCRPIFLRWMCSNFSFFMSDVILVLFCMYLKFVELVEMVQQVGRWTCDQWVVDLTRGTAA